MYIHDRKTKNQILLEIVLSFIPFIVYGIYKNGYLLYQRNLISKIDVFNPLFLVFISLGIYELFYLFCNKKIGWDYDIIHYLILALIVPPFPNLVFYSLSILISSIVLFILKRLKFNHIAFIKLIVIGSLYSFNCYGYMNIMEQNLNFSYDYGNLLMGRVVGGVSSTSLILSILIFLFLAWRKDIKVKVALSSLITFMLINTIYLIYLRNWDFNFLFNANIIFALLFVASENMSSPNTKNGMLIYGIIIGLLTCLFTYVINPFEGVYVAIILASFGQNLYEKCENFKFLGKKARKNKGNKI